jgi:EAL domain-containing protein (putative c-di-GMP-specific phosphodiesterase class I)
VGAVVATDQLLEASDYIRAADMALYAAKAAGRNCYRFFTHELDEAAKRRDRLETDLRKALQSGSGLSVHFQPQLDAQGVVVGVESLFRWTHPTLGAIPASEAIAVAEECDLISRVSEFVFRRAARLARTHRRLSVAVNLSPLQFLREESLCESLLSIAREENVPPDQLELEVTEQLFMRLDAGCEQQIQSLRNGGFRLSLDDFGTGYSSLSYLRRFKVDRLKLDRSFVTSAAAEDNITLIRAAVTFAHSLGLEVVAEGVESPLHHSVALGAGCDAVQGNHYARPMTAEELDEFLASQCQAAA